MSKFLIISNKKINVLNFGINFYIKITNYIFKKID